MSYLPIKIIQINDRVQHVLDASRVGLITGILNRANGYTYLVTWQTDVVEKYHFEMELEPAVAPAKPCGFKSP